MDIIIRKATVEDAYNFALCHISCFQTAYKGIVPDDYLENMSEEKQQRVERYKKNLADPGDCEYYCVMYGERMIGFIIIHNLGEIWAIYLIDEFRGMGYGKKMLDFAISELKNSDCKEISLWVFEDNHSARRFYEKNNLSFSGISREMTYGIPLIQLRYVLNTTV